MRIGPLLRFLWYAERRGGLSTQRFAMVETFTDGATPDLPGRPRIIHIPGHTPDSVPVHVPSVDAVFVGDALTTGDVPWNGGVTQAVRLVRAASASPNG